MLLIFWISFPILVYIYFGYPVTIYLLSKIIHQRVSKDNTLSNVTILIAVYNESKHISATIENKLSLDYPKDKLELIVISDGSDDGTDEIVRGYANFGVKLIRQEPRNGKTSALNLAVPHAKGEILVFSDANSLYAPEALRKLINNFADPSVGYVTGKMIYVNPDGTTIGDSCSAYMKYENLIRSLETNVGSVVGVDGGIDAIKKKLYKPMRADQLPDFVLPLMVIKQGFRVVYDPEALLMEDTLKKSEDEYRMRVRVSLRALWALWDMRILLNPFRFGIFSFQLLVHKILRYLAIVFILIVYLANIILLFRSKFFKIIFILQSLFYGAAALAHKLEKSGKSPGILFIPYYFMLINIAAGHALIRFMKKEKQVLWTPRKG
jgi:cellulose synthase/poly-beta-1,6-N-acetylglucosamine synthase-like glycosyltransferase